MLRTAGQPGMRMDVYVWVAGQGLGGHLLQILNRHESISLYKARGI